MTKRRSRMPGWLLGAPALFLLANARCVNAQQLAQEIAPPASLQPSSTVSFPLVTDNGLPQSKALHVATCSQGPQLPRFAELRSTAAVVDCGMEPLTSGSPAQTETPQFAQAGPYDPASRPAIQTSAPASVPVPLQQPKRILGVMPNYRAVSAGEFPPPPTPIEAFKLATQNSFDYSSFAFVGITSLWSEGSNAHPQLGKGAPGFGRYYWRGFVDKTDGNYLVIFALPTLLHQDERYFALGQGGFWKRGLYSATRVFITPNYQGHNSLNLSELLGRGMAQGISASYYPSHDRTLGALATKYAYAIGRDALTNVFREFWPDIATHMRHRHP